MHFTFLRKHPTDTGGVNWTMWIQIGEGACAPFLPAPGGCTTFRTLLFPPAVISIVPDGVGASEIGSGGVSPSMMMPCPDILMSTAGEEPATQQAPSFVQRHSPSNPKTSNAHVEWIQRAQPFLQE